MARHSKEVTSDCRKKKGRTLEEELLFFFFLHLHSPLHHQNHNVLCHSPSFRLGRRQARVERCSPQVYKGKKGIVTRDKKIAGIVIVITSPDSFFLIQEQSEKRTPTSKDQIQGRNQDKTTIQLN